MDKTAISLIIFVVLSIGISLLLHKNVTKYLLACISSSIATVSIYQILGIMIIGYLDPFFIYGLIAEIIVSLIIAIFVGIPFLYFRFKKSRNEPGETERRC